MCTATSWRDLIKKVQGITSPHWLTGRTIPRGQNLSYVGLRQSLWGFSDGQASSCGSWMRLHILFYAFRLTEKMPLFVSLLPPGSPLKNEILQHHSDHHLRHANKDVQYVHTLVDTRDPGGVYCLCSCVTKYRSSTPETLKAHDSCLS